MDSVITICGNLTRDPEIRFTQNGVCRAVFGVAVNRRKKVGDQWQDDEPSFFNVVCWRDLGQNVGESLAKGNRVIVTGKMEQRSWEQDGEKRSVFEINAHDVAPSLRWATAEVTRVSSSSGPRNAPPADSYQPPEEEPF